MSSKELVLVSACLAGLQTRAERDGDLQEGVSSESCSLAAHLGLDNIIVVYDDNHISIDGDTSLSFTEDRAKRVEAYGWHVQVVGGDANEGFEIAGPANRDLSTYVVYHYNGSNGQLASGSNQKSLTGTIDNEKNGRGAVWFDWPGLQNGSPDGLALVHESEGVTNLLQFVSYEGTFVAVGGPADGFKSIDIGVSEPETTPLGQSLQLTGTGHGYTDFTWTGPTLHSRGLLNTGQDIRLSATIFIVR